jgi:quinol monooxygenase YgiN
VTHVFATLVARPDTVDALREMLQALVPASRAEPGCLEYRLFQSTQEPARFQTAERWASEAAWREHLATAHVSAAIRQAPHLLAEVPVIQQFAEVA